MWWDRCCESWLCVPSGDIIQSVEPKEVQVVTCFRFSGRIWPQIISKEIKPIFGLALFNAQTDIFIKHCRCILGSVVHRLRWGHDTRKKLVKVKFLANVQKKQKWCNEMMKECSGILLYMSLTAESLQRKTSKLSQKQSCVDIVSLTENVLQWSEHNAACTVNGRATPLEEMGVCCVTGLRRCVCEEIKQKKVDFQRK